MAKKLAATKKKPAAKQVAKGKSTARPAKTGKPLAKPAAKAKGVAKPAPKAKSSGKPAPMAKPVAKASSAKGKIQAAKPPKAAKGGTLKKLLSTVVKRVGAVTKPSAKPAAKASSSKKPLPGAKPGIKAQAKPIARGGATVTAKPAAKPAPKAAAKSPAKPVPKAAPQATAKPAAASKGRAPATPELKVVAPAKAASKAQSAAADKAPSTKPVAVKADQGKGAKTAKAPEPVVVAPTAPRPKVGKVAVAVPVADKKHGVQLAPLGPIKVKEGEVVRPKLPAGYKPGTKEQYMGPLQLEYFRQKLTRWRADLVEESKQTIDNLRDEVRDVGDDAERATRETENSLELRTRDRYRKLLSKIDKALRRIDDGEYGYCEETGEEIGLDRLEARPIATLCLDAQERWEIRQRQMGD